MKVTVLGGLGYIGSHLVRRLVNFGYYVTILDIGFFGHNHIQPVLDRPHCNLIIGDTRNLVDLSEAIKGADAVIHLSGIVGDPACNINADDTWLHNIETTTLIVDICNYYKVKRLIYASSCSVYGAAPSGVTLNEGSYLNPISLYAHSKVASEKVILTGFENVCTILRLSTVFGYSPRMRFDLVANLFTIQAIKNKKIQVHGGRQYRPFIHCEDAAEAFIRVLEHKNTKEIDKEIFNVCKENTTIRELGELVAKLVTGTELELVNVKEDDRNYKVSANKLQWLIGFFPKQSLSTGISNMEKVIIQRKFDDWKTNRWKYSNYENFVEKSNQH